MTVAKIKQLYKAHGVTRKQVILKKCWRRPDNFKLIEQDKAKFASGKKMLEKYRNEGQEIIYVDECLFTNKTHKSTAYSARGQNIIQT